MAKHELTLNCVDYKQANYDIVIEGLGWVSIQGRGTANFILYIPENVHYHIRDDPLRPFEANQRGLKKFYGNTINARSKRNMKQHGIQSTLN